MYLQGVTAAPDAQGYGGRAGFNPQDPYGMGLGGMGQTNQTPTAQQTGTVAPGSLTTPTGPTGLPQWAQSYFGARGDLADQGYGQQALGQYMNWAKQYNTNAQGQTDYNYTPWAFKANSSGGAAGSLPNGTDFSSPLAGGGFDPTSYNLNPSSNYNMQWVNQGGGSTGYANYNPFTGYQNSAGATTSNYIQPPQQSSVFTNPATSAFPSSSTFSTPGLR